MTKVLRDDLFFKILGSQDAPAASVRQPANDRFKLVVAEDHVELDDEGQVSRGVSLLSDEGRRGWTALGFRGNTGIVLVGGVAAHGPCGRRNELFRKLHLLAVGFIAVAARVVPIVTAGGGDQSRVAWPVLEVNGVLVRWLLWL